MPLVLRCDACGHDHVLNFLPAVEVPARPVLDLSKEQLAQVIAEKRQATAEARAEEAVAQLRNHLQYLPDLRREVVAFAYAMEAQLRQHDAERGEDGWKKATKKALMDRLHEELQELAEELGQAGSDPRNVVREAADVANFCLFLADAHGSLVKAEDLPRVVGVGRVVQFSAQAKRRFIAALQRNEDKEITCLACKGTRCDLCFETQANGVRSWIGFHSRCVPPEALDNPTDT